MKKITIFSKRDNIRSLVSAALVAWASTGHAQITSPTPYCASEFATNYNMFDNIRIKGTTLSFGAMGNWMPSGKNTYLYYNTTTFPDLKKSDTFSVQLNVYAVADIEPGYFALWIDYNHNNTFDDTELVMENANTTMALLPFGSEPVSPINKTLTVPATAVTGITRARLIRGTNSTNPYGGYSASFHLSPCTVTTPDYGCTYDFDLNIVDEATGINEIVLNTTGLCYPNPANGTITVSLKGISQEGIVTLYDLTGKAIKTINYKNGEAILPVWDIANGIYYIKANSGNRVLTEKIVITH